ncbi:hypothetical protein F5X98DRAFT_332639 [Xylaria grammica]|nr:hypothetical protein F5X98DRAFT_332639 [Xylaria grammica]
MPSLYRILGGWPGCWLLAVRRLLRFLLLASCFLLLRGLVFCQALSALLTLHVPSTDEKRQGTYLVGRYQVGRYVGNAPPPRVSV